VECVKCAEKKISRITSTGKTGKPRHLYQCLICRTQFTVRTGTIFRDSHLPLTHWFKAIALVCGSKRTINVTRLQRELNVQYRTASYLLLRIHRAIESGGQLEDSVTSATNDPNLSNNADSESTTVQPGADLSVTKTDSADPVKPDAPFSYILAVNNAGPDTALNVVVTDTLPVGVTFLSASGNHWKCTLSLGTVTCTRPDLNVGGPKDITIRVTAPSQRGTIVNTASVTSATNDPNPSNNAASESTTVQ
jgi:uncharacterized repeat protein (TIGR01451 family)